MDRRRNRDYRQALAVMTTLSAFLFTAAVIGGLVRPVF